MTNELKRKLNDGKVVIGSFVYIPSSKLTEIIGMTGFDFVVIDMEHGPIDMGHAEDMIRAADVAGVTPIVRVSHNTRHLIMRALDIGAHALHVPDINTEQQVRTCGQARDGRSSGTGIRSEGTDFRARSTGQCGDHDHRAHRRY